MPHKVAVIGLARRGLDRGQGRGLMQRGAPRRPTAGWSATCSTARGSCAAWRDNGALARRARRFSSSARAAWARRSPPPRAAAGAAEIGALRRQRTPRWRRSRGGCRQNYPQLKVDDRRRTIPTGFDVVVNATPLGMKAGDPMPVDVSRLSPSTFVGEVVMKQETTAFLAAAQARGCETQIGDRHAVRADPRLSRVLRLSVGDADGTESGRARSITRAGNGQTRREERQ